MRKEPRMTSFPGEMLSGILLRLSPKSLVRFGCVSKSWESRATSPSFVRSHLDHSIKHRQVTLLKHDDDDENRLLKLSTGSGGGKLSNFDLGPSFPAGAERFELVGSYNGVLCIAIFSQNDPGRSRIYLCNPSTNESIVVTTMKTFADAGPNGSLERFPVVEMYSLRTNSWKMIGSLSPSWTRGWMDRHIIFKEFICWCSDSGEEDKSFSIRLFGVADEVFYEMPVLEGLLLDGSRFLHATLGCLSLIGCNQTEEYEIWVMKEFGVPESWTVLHWIETTSWKYGFVYRPLGFCSSEVIFIRTNMVFEGRKQKSWTIVAAYDIDTGKGRRLSIPLDGRAGCCLVPFVEEFDIPRGAGKWFPANYSER